MEWARGRNVILLKVSVFNHVIFISLFVVRVNSFGLQRQVRQKWCSQMRLKQSVKQLMVGQLFRNFLLAFHEIISEFERGGKISYFILFLGCRVLVICLYSEFPLPAACDCGCALVHFSNKCHTGL